MRIAHVFSLTAALVLAGCTASREAARDKLLQQELETNGYQVDIDTAWTQALKLLAERGFLVGEKDRPLVGQEKSGFLAGLADRSKSTEEYNNGRRAAETDWVVVNPNTGGKLRYRIEGLKTGDKSCQVKFFVLRIPYPDGNNIEEPPARDLEMELELLRAVEPDRATQILEKADAAN